MFKKYNSYSVNGYTFHTRGYAEGKATQCDAVALVAKTSSFSSWKDNNPSVGDVAYYGRISEIIELNCSNTGHVVLFKCDWVDSVHQGRGIRKNKFGTTQVNFNNLLNSGNDVFDGPSNWMWKYQFFFSSNCWYINFFCTYQKGNKGMWEGQLRWRGCGKSMILTARSSWSSIDMVNHVDWRYAN